MTGALATLTIDRPDRRGAMTYTMLEEFAAGVTRAGADPEVAVLLVTGGSFCSGIDPADLAARAPEERGHGGKAEPPPLMAGGRTWRPCGRRWRSASPPPIIRTLSGLGVFR